MPAFFDTWAGTRQALAALLLALLMPAAAAADTPTEAAADTPTEAAADTPTEAAADTPTEAAAGVPGKGVRLLMLDQAWCAWCERWDAEIAPAYPLTSEGRAAPLVRHDIWDPLPEGVRLARPARYTPTFVLLCGGRELGRIEGYPGDDFFWGLLSRLLQEHGLQPGAASAETTGARCNAQS
ncbi:MAG: hypothetical protein AAF677_13280 [Pseudomonadota bacterium]